MTALKNHPGFWLRSDAAAAFDRAEADHGTLTVNSAGRFESDQQALINRWNAGGTHNRPPYLFKPAMPASASNHVKDGGKAVDVANYKTFAGYCAGYGFVQSFPDGDPVHFDFVGHAPSGNPGANQTTKDRQNWLLSIGISVGASGADGIEGEGTKAGYKVYQTDLKAHWGYTGEIDGLWGAGTQAAHQRKFDSMHAAPAPTPAGNLTTASFGSVKAVQDALRTKYPLYAGKLKGDNQDGPQTISAVKQFQSRAGLKVDGIAGPATRKALGL